MSRYKSQWYADYMRSPHWVETRERMIELAGRVCEFCGAPENHTAWNEFIALNVHHVNYDHLWHETRADLIVLCHDCHSDAHKFPKRLEEIKRFAARRPLPDHYAKAEAVEPCALELARQIAQLPAMQNAVDQAVTVYALNTKEQQR